MKKSKILLAVMVGFITLTMVSSCSKDEKTSSLGNVENRTSSYIIPTTGKVQLTNSMLEFASIQEFNSILTELNTKTSDPSAVSGAYNHLNIIADGENLVCRNPVNLTFENSLGFNSFRKYEENRYFQHVTSNAGDETTFVKESQLWDDPHYQSLFNVNREVKIGSKIFKVYESGEMLVVANNDWTRFNQIKNLNPLDIPTQYNVRLLSHEKDENNFLYDQSSSDSRIEKDVIDLKIGFERTNSSNYSVINRSFVNYTGNPNVSYKWTFSDGTIQYGVNPTRFITDLETVSLQVFKDGSGGPIINAGPLEDGIACDFKFKVTQKADCIFEILAEVPPSSIGRIDFIPPGGPISNGTNTANGVLFKVKATTRPFTVFIRVYDKNGKFLCNQEVTLICGEIGCGKEREKNNNDFIFAHGGRTWRLKVKIWCRSSTFGSKVGSLTDVNRKNGLNIWVDKSVDEVRASFIGRIYDNKGECPLQVVPYSEDTEFNNHHVEANISTPFKNPVYKNNECRSTHWCRIGSTKFIFPFNGGFMILD